MFRELPGLWQQLKAELALPLQAGLCMAEGVAPPGSLLMLPIEVKQCCFQNLEVRKTLALTCPSILSRSTPHVLIKGWSLPLTCPL